MNRIRIDEETPQNVRDAADRFEAAADQLEELGGTEAMIRGIYTEARIDAIVQALANMMSGEDLAKWTADVFDSTAESLGEHVEALRAAEAAAHDALDAEEDGKPLTPAERAILDALTDDGPGES